MDYTAVQFLIAVQTIINGLYVKCLHKLAGQIVGQLLKKIYLNFKLMLFLMNC